MTARLPRLALAAALAGLWIVVALLLWRSRVPGGLELPELDPRSVFTAAEVDRAEDYERLARWVAVGAIAAELVALGVLAWRGPRLVRGMGLGPIGAGIVIGLVTMLTVWAVGIPFDLVLHWWDRRYDLTDLGYAEAILAPYAQLFGLTATALVVIVVVMSLARRLGRLWWLAGAPAFAAIAAAFAFMLPYLIALTLEPVRDPALRAEIGRLEQATGAGPTEVGVQEVSDFTTLPNAYAAGFGPSERVVLWDTLLDGRFSRAEVLIVTAHELGHVAREHVFKGLAWFALLAFPLLAAISEATRPRGGLGRPENVPLAALALTLASLAVAPASNAINRHFEQEADWIALEATRNPAAARTLFDKLATVSLSDPTPPSWSQGLFGTHPSALDRIAMSEAWRVRNR